MDNITKDFYNKFADEFEESTVDLSPEVLHDFVDLISPGGKILDVGCAYGRDLRIFADMGFEVVGIDFSQSLIDKAQVLVPEAELHCMDMNNFTSEPDSFDGIWACASLLHLRSKDMRPMLEKFYQALKPGGVLYVGVKIAQESGEGYVVDQRYGNVEKFYKYFSEDEIKSLLQEAGFAIKQAGYTNPSKYRDKSFIDIIVMR